MIVLNTKALQKHAYLKTLLDKDNTFINNKYLRLHIEGNDFRLTLNTSVFQLESNLSNAVIGNDETFDVGVDGNQFFTAINALGSENTTMKIKDNTLSINDENTRIKLAVIRGDEIEDFNKSLHDDNRKYTYFTVGDITKLLPFTSNDNSGFSGITIDGSDTSKLTFFATNRHHIAQIERGIDESGASITTSILPKAVVASLGKLGANVNIGIANGGDGLLLLKYDESDGTNGIINTRLLNFPTRSLADVFAKVPSTKFNIDREELKSVVDTLRTLTDDTTASLTIKDSQDGLILVLNHPDFNKKMRIAGEVVDEFEVSIDIDGLLLGLSVFGDKYVDLYADNTAPFVMFANDNNKTIHAKKRRF